MDTYVSARAVTPQCTHACLQAALWRQEKFCDVKLRIGEEVVPAHRLVLAAQSQFLNALFDGGFKDSSAAIVELKEMEPSVFALVVDWMYDDSCALADASDKRLRWWPQALLSLSRARHACRQQA